MFGFVFSVAVTLEKRIENLTRFMLGMQIRNKKKSLFNRLDGDGSLVLKKY